MYVIGSEQTLRECLTSCYQPSGRHETRFNRQRRQSVRAGQLMVACGHLATSGPDDHRIEFARRRASIPILTCTPAESASSPPAGAPAIGSTRHARVPLARHPSRERYSKPSSEIGYTCAIVRLLRPPAWSLSVWPPWPPAPARPPVVVPRPPAVPRLLQLGQFPRRWHHPFRPLEAHRLCPAVTQALGRLSPSPPHRMVQSCG